MDGDRRAFHLGMSILYTAEATAWGGREGRAASNDGNLDVNLVLPKEMGGPGGAGTNPEQLFAAGYAGCFHSALKLVARGAGVDVSESAITAKVGIGPNDSGGFGLAVQLEAELPGVDPSKAKELLDQAHQVCPYSNATRGNVDVTLTLVDG
ncbi:MAG TPA: organic hydroperoxide resistance protein [Acidimicrobiales bacterium]|nr:organic hydroperoxide resistance protein [Acidimicrobiales bacterium]